MIKFLQSALIFSLLLITLPACAQANSAQTQDSKKELYSDKKQDIYYDESAVCDFLADYIEVQNHITKKEWQDILDGQYMYKENMYDRPTLTARDEDSKILFVMYIYEHDGIKIGYSKYEKQLDRVWSIIFSPDRLPEPLRDISYYINKFKIHNLDNRLHLEFECDGIIMDGYFKGNLLTQLSFAISLSTI